MYHANKYTILSFNLIMRLYSNAYEGKYFINLVDNLSGIYDKESKKCMEEKTIRLNCELDLKMVD